jgi:hypothetical protein
VRSLPPRRPPTDDSARAGDAGLARVAGSAAFNQHGDGLLAHDGAGGGGDALGGATGAVASDEAASTGAGADRISFDILVDRTHPYTVSFDVGADPAAVASAFLREAAVGGADVADAWRAAIEARVVDEVAAVHAAADDLARRLGGAVGNSGGGGAPTRATTSATAPPSSSPPPPAAPPPPASYTLQFTPDADPVGVAWEFLARTGQAGPAAGGGPASGSGASNEVTRWAAEIAAAVAAEQARMRATAAAAAAPAAVGPPGDSSSNSGGGDGAGGGGADHPPAVDRWPTVDVGGGSDGGSDSVSPPAPSPSDGGPDANGGGAAAAAPPGASSPPPLPRRSGGRALLQTAPFDGTVPLAVEGAAPPPSSTSPGDNSGAAATAAETVTPYDIRVVAGESLPEAAHAFCARHWASLEPALRAMLNASAGVPPEALAFAGPSPYDDALAALPTGSPEAAYWAAPGRGVHLHYCAGEVHALMARYFTDRQARRAGRGGGGGGGASASGGGRA